MKVAFYLNIISPHQVPLAREVAKRVGNENFVYIYAEDFHAERASMGWSAAIGDIHAEKLSDGNRHILREADLVYTGIRDLELMEFRAATGKKTFYYSERWFKPFCLVSVGSWDWLLPGWLRMFVPHYRKMAQRFVKWMTEDPNARYLAVGPWAAKDMKFLGVPANKIVPWGYFVEPSRFTAENRSNELETFRILYIGRLLRLKHVDTIIKAVALLKTSLRRSVALSVFGDGPEKLRLEKMVDKLKLGDSVCFHGSVPIAEVRDVIRMHDVMVFASNALDGWGATVSEALEERVSVVGTAETGASAALLPANRIFNCGNYRQLAQILASVCEAGDQGVMPCGYTAAEAAERIVAL